MTANPTEVMTEEDRQYVENQRHVQKTGSFEKSYLRFIAIIDKLLAENASLRSSRDEADKKLAFLKSKGITVGYMKTSDKPEPYLAYVIAIGSELDELPTVNKLIEAEAKVARLEGELKEKCYCNCHEPWWTEMTGTDPHKSCIECAKELRGEAQSVDGWTEILNADELLTKAGLSRQATMMISVPDRLTKLIAERDAARAEVSRLSGELASRPAKELVEAAEQLLIAYASPSLAKARQRLRSALSQASIADALSAPAKEGLTFDQFRKINASRSARWDASAKVDIEFAGVELAGEVGEVCNAVKKLARHRMGMKGGVADTTNLAEELGDVVICADLLAMRTGIDLGEAVAKKFNATSEKHGFPERLPSAFSPAPVAGEPSVTIKTTPVPKWAQDRIDHALTHGTDVVNSGPKEYHGAVHPAVQATMNEDLPTKMKKAHELLDAAKVAMPDGTHGGLLHRLTLLIAERDELRSANEKLVVAVETFLRDARGWEFNNGKQSSKKMKQALRDALPRTRVASEILEGLTELHNTVVGASAQMTCPECGVGPGPCLCDLRDAKKIGSTPEINAGPDAGVTLTTRDFLAVTDLLKSPPPPNDALKRAFEDYRIKVAPASAVSPASEEKDAKGEVVVYGVADGAYWVDGLPEGEFWVWPYTDTFKLVGRKSGYVAHDKGLVPTGEPRRTEILTAFWPLYEKWKAEQVSPTPAPAPSDGAPGAAKKDHLQEGAEKVQRKCYRCGAGVVDQAEMEEECFGCVRQDLEELRSKVERIGAALDAMKGGAK